MSVYLIHVRMVELVMTMLMNSTAHVMLDIKEQSVKQVIENWIN